MGRVGNVPEFSVVLPSFNGEDTLPRCLSALKKVKHPTGGVEFIFVDNNSDDRTTELLESAARELNGVLLTEKRQGKSFSLNTAIATSRGKFLVFTDDDTIADPDWLIAFEAAVTRHPKVNAFAGQVRPFWLGGVPDWLEQIADLGRACGCTRAGLPEGPYPADHVKGANMMIRRDCLKESGFDTKSVNFGASTLITGGEDTKLMLDLSKGGEEIIYVPAARLLHILQENEVTLAALFTRQLRIGRSSARISGMGLRKLVSCVLSVPAYALVSMPLVLIGQKKLAALQVLKIASRIGQLQVWTRTLS